MMKPERLLPKRPQVKKKPWRKSKNSNTPEVNGVIRHGKLT